MPLDRDQIDSFIKKFDQEAKALKEELLKICWYMRGSVSYSESHQLTIDERIYITNLIEENLKTTKETNLPFF